MPDDVAAIGTLNRWIRRRYCAPLRRRSTSSGIKCAWKSTSRRSEPCGRRTALAGGDGDLHSRGLADAVRLAPRGHTASSATQDDSRVLRLRSGPRDPGLRGRRQYTHRINASPERFDSQAFWLQPDRTNTPAQSRGGEGDSGPAIPVARSWREGAGHITALPAFQGGPLTFSLRATISERRLPPVLSSKARRSRSQPSLAESVSRGSAARIPATRSRRLVGPRAADRRAAPLDDRRLPVAD